MPQFLKPVLNRHRKMNPTKLVHIDLKGAQFKSGPEGFFWQKFCSLVSRWGASGLLIEWEDAVRIPTLASDPSPEFSYDRNQAEWLVDIAHKNNLVVCLDWFNFWSGLSFFHYDHL